MDDQPKEGAEGDKKIVHVYPLVKVSSAIADGFKSRNASVQFTRLFSNYPSCDKWQKGSQKDVARKRTIACVNMISDQISNPTTHISQLHGEGTVWRFTPTHKNDTSNDPSNCVAFADADCALLPTWLLLARRFSLFLLIHKSRKGKLNIMNAAVSRCIHATGK